MEDQKSHAHQENNFFLFLKENMEREAKEAARRQWIQELEEKKRHSWAGGEKVGWCTQTL